MLPTSRQQTWLWWIGCCVGHLPACSLPWTWLAWWRWTPGEQPTWLLEQVFVHTCCLFSHVAQVKPFAACRICKTCCCEDTAQTHFGDRPLHGAGDGGLGAALHSATIGIALSSNQQTGLKLLCNALRHTELQQWLQASLPALQDGFAQCCSSEQKTVRLSYATFMLNLSTLFYGTLRDDVEGQAQVSSAALLCMCCDSTG